jgi:hypothetical protein
MDGKTLEKVIKRAKADPKFFHALVFNPDAIASEIKDREAMAALYGIDPETFIGSILQNPLEKCGTTCGDDSCITTCGGDTCSSTCASSCGDTCKSSCVDTTKLLGAVGGRVTVGEPGTVGRARRRRARARARKKTGRKSRRS